MNIRKFLLGIVLTAAILSAGCGTKKTVHCDGCGKEIEVSADSNVDEDWILYCSDCQEKLGIK